METTPVTAKGTFPSDPKLDYYNRAKSLEARNDLLMRLLEESSSMLKLVDMGLRTGYVPKKDSQVHEKIKKLVIGISHLLEKGNA